LECESAHVTNIQNRSAAHTMGEGQVNIPTFVYTLGGCYCCSHRWNVTIETMN